MKTNQQDNREEVDLHLLARDADVRETCVFPGTVTGIHMSKGYCFVDFGAVKDGLLRRTSVRAKNKKSKQMWDRPLKVGSQLRVMVNRVVLEKDIRKVRIALRVAPFEHAKKDCGGLVKKQALPAKRTSVQPTPAKQPNTRPLQVKVVGKFEKTPKAASTPPPAPTEAKKWDNFAPTKHFAPSADLSNLDRPKAKTEKAQAEAKAFWRRGANLGIPQPEAAAPAAMKSKSTKRRQRRAAAKARAAGGIPVESTDADAEPDVDAVIALLSQLSKDQLAEVLQSAGSVANGA